MRTVRQKMQDILLLFLLTTSQLHSQIYNKQETWDKQSLRMWDSLALEHNEHGNELLPWYFDSDDRSLNLTDKFLYHQNCNFLSQIIPQLDSYEISNNVIKLSYPVNFKYSLFKEANKASQYNCTKWKYNLSEDLSFTNCIFQGQYFFELFEIYGTLIFYKSQLDLLNIYSSSENNDIHFTDNIINNKLIFNDLDKLSLNLGDNQFIEDTSNVTIISSTIIDFWFKGNIINNFNLRFISDSLFNEFSLGFSFRTSDEKLGIQNIIFDRSYIDCSINASSVYQKTNLKFSSCYFGPNCRLLELNVDTIEFENCKIDMPLSLSCSRYRNRTTILKFTGTNLDNLQMDYFGKFELFKGGVGNQEIIKGNFENLLAKFDREHKLESHKNLSIEYFKYKNGPIISFFSRIWWYYGYRTYCILIWTFVFLIFFYIINILKWKVVSETYPVVQLPKEHTQATEVKFRKYLTIFVFTIFIFFSLKIDFNKLSFKRPAIVMYFFLQYLVGLICLFFIFNAILKL